MSINYTVYMRVEKIQIVNYISIYFSSICQTGYRAMCPFVCE